MPRFAALPATANKPTLDGGISGATMPSTRDQVASNSPPVISAEEQRRREAAFQFASGSIGLEGFAMSPAVQARAKRFIAGEIDLAEFLQAQ